MTSGSSSRSCSLGWVRVTFGIFPGNITRPLETGSTPRQEHSQSHRNVGGRGTGILAPSEAARLGEGGGRRGALSPPAWPRIGSPLCCRAPLPPQDAHGGWARVSPPPPAAAAAGPTGSLSRAVCAPHEFQCSNRTCLAAVFVCDGDDDCGDGSDERGCADPACGPREFRCSGGSGACIPERWVCDRQFDCEDRSDEAAELCGRAGPGATAAPAACAAAAQFACRSGECVHLGWRCDGDRDCKDKSDEADCRKPPPPTPVPRGPAALPGPA